MSSEDDNKHFLSRWSERKLHKPDEKATPGEKQEPAADLKDTPAATEAEQKRDEEKDNTEATAAVPIWQRDDVDAETKKQALRELFHKPQFNVRDGLNEYDDDFTQFAGLGDIVTHEMKRMMKVAEKTTRPGEPAGDDSRTTSVEQDKPDQQAKNEEQEDDGIA